MIIRPLFSHDNNKGSKFKPTKVDILLLAINMFIIFILYLVVATVKFILNSYCGYQLEIYEQWFVLVVAICFFLFWFCYNKLFDKKPVVGKFAYIIIPVYVIGLLTFLLTFTSNMKYIEYQNEWWQDVLALYTVIFMPLLMTIKILFFKK